MNRSMRIARTEGHRIQNEAKMDSLHAAAEKGAEIVKQWDATLDGATRETHQELDGQIRELDEDFTCSGGSAPYPGGFGDPAEDCNCRCCMLQRARWAVKDETTYQKWNNQTGGIIECSGYEDFKDKYLEVAENVASQATTPLVNSGNINMPNTWNSKQTTMSQQEDVKASNPSYSSGREYKINCQRCVPTYEMRRRGYDVTAKPYIMKGKDNVASQWKNIFDGANWLSVGTNSTASTQKAVVDEMLKFGDGSRAEIYVVWKGGSSAHVFVAENIGGTVHFIDPQNGNTDVSSYFKDIMPSGTQMCRLDNLQPSALIGGCCK